MKVEDVHRLERAERAMVRWMCGMTLKNITRSDELLERLGVESITDVIRRGRLGWFWHLERREEKDWVSACRNLKVGDKRGRGRGRKTCDVGRKSVLMKTFGLSKEMAQDRSLWRSYIHGNRPTRASTEKRTLRR